MCGSCQARGRSCRLSSSESMLVAMVLCFTGMGGALGGGMGGEEQDPLDAAEWMRGLQII